MVVSRFRKSWLDADVVAVDVIQSPSRRFRRANPRLRAISVAAALAALALAGCGSSSRSQPKPAATATPADTTTTTSTTSFEAASCVANGSNQVDCTLPNDVGRPYFELPTLVNEAQAVNSGVSGSTPMVITAYGGAGHNGYAAGAGNHRQHGDGGLAQTTTTSDSWDVDYKTPILFYYLGLQGSGTYSGIWKGGVGGLGGSATIVSPDDLTSSASTLAEACIVNVSGSQYDESGCSKTNVVVLAGGGAGGGEGATCNGGYGGDGGTAIASTGGPTNGSGHDGGDGSCYGGHRGEGGNEGNHGSGGDGGDGVDSHAGGSGNDGVGGMGGPVHTENGASAAEPWFNVGY
jgi:hypothetical protein